MGERKGKGVKGEVGRIGHGWVAEERKRNNGERNA